MPDVGASAKVCHTCRAERPLSDFGKQSAQKDGLRKVCRACSSKYYTAYYQKTLEVRRRRAREYLRRQVMKPSMLAEKTCNRCHRVKPAADFHRRRGGSGLNSYCKPCNLEISKEWTRKNPDKAKVSNIIQTYAVDKEKAWSLLLRLKEGSCEICGTKERLVVEHNHETGELRGILCGTHNTGIAFFHDSISDMESGIRYLKRYGHV